MEWNDTFVQVNAVITAVQMLVAGIWLCVKNKKNITRHYL